jgi:hypothetical protein
MFEVIKGQTCLKRSLPANLINNAKNMSISITYNNNKYINYIIGQKEGGRGREGSSLKLEYCINFINHQ